MPIVKLPIAVLLLAGIRAGMLKRRDALIGRFRRRMIKWECEMTMPRSERSRRRPAC